MAIGFAQMGPQGRGGPGFCRQAWHGQHFGPRRGPQGFGAARLFGKIAHLAQGSTVTASFYDADPSTGAVATNSLSLVAGVDSERAFVKSFKEFAETANFVVVKTGPQSRTIELNKEKAGNMRYRHSDSKITMMLSQLNLNSTVTVSFYNANPSDGAAATTTLNFVAGQDSELAFKNAFKAAAENSGWATISVSAQEHTINLAEMRAQRAEMQNRMDRRGFGRGFWPWQGQHPGGR